jgi:hypothetical protein
MLPGWSVKISWLTFTFTEVRACGLQHVPQFKRSATNPRIHHVWSIQEKETRRAVHSATR